MTEQPIADPRSCIRNDLMHAARRLASRRVRRRRAARAGIVAGGGVALLGRGRYRGRAPAGRAGAAGGQARPRAPSTAAYRRTCG